jgi:hypothetical protein
MCCPYQLVPDFKIRSMKLVDTIYTNERGEREERGTDDHQ